MTNYNLVHQAKQCFEHGGLIIYVHELFKCAKTKLIIEQTSGWEYLCVEISNNRQPSTKHLCNIYRKPSDLRDEFELFATQFSSLVTNIKNIKRTSHICGDFNIDLLKIKEKKHYNDYFEVSKYIEVEKADEISLQNVINKLKLFNIYDQLETKLHTNPETNHGIFTKLLKFVKDKHIPKRTIKYKKHLHMKSKWMTNRLLRSIKMKDKLYKTLLQTTVNLIQIYL